MLDFLLSSSESISPMLVLPQPLYNPTSLGCFEVDSVAAGAVAPPVEGHDDEAVLREGR